MTKNTYYKDQLTRLQETEKDCVLVKFYGVGSETKMMSLNEESAKIIVDYLKKTYLTKKV